MKLENVKGKVQQGEFFPKGGFTLVELLVVIALIAVLSSLAISGTSKIRLNSQRAQAGLVVKLVDGAVEKFYSDHNRLPDVGGYSADEEFTLVEDDADGVNLMQELLGEDDATQNFKKKQYLIIDDAEANTAGVHRVGAEALGKGLFDPWGGSYQVILDYDYDEKVKMPAKYVEVSGGADEVTGKRVLVWTTGKDEDETTDDDVASWTNIR